MYFEISFLIELFSETKCVRSFKNNFPGGVYGLKQSRLMMLKSARKAFLKISKPNFAKRATSKLKKSGRKLKIKSIKPSCSQSWICRKPALSNRPSLSDQKTNRSYSDLKKIRPFMNRKLNSIPKNWSRRIRSGCWS